MSKGKYKRKRERARERAKQELTQVGCLKAEIVAPKKQPKPSETSDSKRHKKEPTPMGFSEFIKRSSLTDWGLTLFTLALTVTAFYQYRITGRQLEVMHIDQRAWMSTTIKPVTEGKDTWPALPKEGEVLAVYTHIENTGKTPALQIHYVVSMEEFRNGIPPDLSDTGTNHFEGTTGITFPNRSQDIRTASFHTTGNPPPGSQVYPIPDKLTKQDVDDLMEGRAYLAVFGRIDYRDVFGISHWTTFCHWKAYSAGTFSARDCTAHNGVDDDQ
ncbi:MAG TPA: hypothetical protein VGN01_08455 [Acidobacteriaceae bacterium]|jgi:hypothetical protein